MADLNMIMFRDYEEKAKGTDLIDDLEGLDPKWVYYVLGLCGETGELADKVKKMFRDDQGCKSVKHRADLVAEAGDVLWYLTRMMNYLGISLQEVAEKNIEKLYHRRATGTLHGSGDNR